VIISAKTVNYMGLPDSIARLADSLILLTQLLDLVHDPIQDALGASY